MVYLLMCDNWWGAHYMTVRYELTESTFLVEIVESLNFVMMAMLASQSSPYMHLTLVMYGLSGVLWNSTFLGIVASESEERAMLKLWNKYAGVLAAGYLVLFVIYRAMGVGVLAKRDVAVTVVVWLLWRVILMRLSWTKTRKLL
jgi:hypothetical protein